MKQVTILSLVAFSVALSVGCGPRLPEDDSGETDDSDDGSDTSTDTSDTSGDTSDTSGDTSDTASGEVGVDEIQTGLIATGSVVTVKGVVVNGVQWDAKAFYVQDPDLAQNAGLQVWLNQDADDYAVGDIVDITAEFTEPYGAARLGNRPVIIKTGTATPPLAPITVPLATLGAPASAEAYESMFVKITGNFTISNMSPDAPNDYSEIMVSDGTNQIRVSGKFHAYRTDFGGSIPAGGNPGTWGTLSEGDSFTSIQGVLLYDFNNFKIAVHSGADLAGYVDAAN